MGPNLDDPWGGRTPWLRRRAPRIAISLLAVGSFLALTLMSTCSTRTTPPPATTSTTAPGTQALPILPTRSAGPARLRQHR
ncbi:MAG: hypothetical protein ABIJ48_12820 [Actinomycetota bacterium]